MLAHVTPSYDTSGNIDGYHSNRRVPNVKTVQEKIIPLYKSLLLEEGKHSNSKQGMNGSYDMLMKVLKEKGVGYDQFIFSL